MILKRRLELLSRLGNYMRGEDAPWQEVKQRAFMENGWFMPEFVELAVKNIAENFLEKDKLNDWVRHYNRAGNHEESNVYTRTVGIVMAGNIPLVGFHDFLSVFASGHKAAIKPSSRDNVLIRHIVETLTRWNPEMTEWVSFSEILRNCDAYIATGSNNTSRYFEYYFAKYHHIIRRNKTSVAILNGDETDDELERLADDVFQFFGLGCRNVTKIFVPLRYKFERLLTAFRKYSRLADHNKYKNNLDYNMTILILNKKFYMTNGSVLLVEEPSIFSPISQLNYEYYTDKGELLSLLHDSQDIQSVVARDHIPFGEAQRPTLFDYADNMDTMAFLHSLKT